MPYLLVPEEPFLNGRAKNNKAPKGINVTNNHHALAFRSCSRRTMEEKKEKRRRNPKQTITRLITIIVMVDSFEINFNKNMYN